MKKKPENIKQVDWDAVNSPPLSKKIISRMKAVSKAHPDMPSRVRGPQLTPTKRQITLRLNREVVDYFKLQGRGWQTKINDVLIDYIHSNNDTDSAA
jgi:uncharacterized protein (DUF4415 family)